MADKLPPALQNTNMQPKSKELQQNPELILIQFLRKVIINSLQNFSTNCTGASVHSVSRNFFSAIEQRIRESGDHGHFLFCDQPPSLHTHHSRQSSAGAHSPHFLPQPRSCPLQPPTSVVNYSSSVGKCSDLVGISEKAAKSQNPHAVNQGNIAHLSSHMLCSAMSKETT